MFLLGLVGLTMGSLRISLFFLALATCALCEGNSEGVPTPFLHGGGPSPLSTVVYITRTFVRPCSGVLITTTRVLTAATCIAETGVTVTYTISFTDGSPDGTSTTGQRHPSYSPQVVNGVLVHFNNVGFLTLAAAAPATIGVTALPVLTDFLANYANQQVTLVGWGLVSTVPDPVRSPRAGWTTVLPEARCPYRILNPSFCTAGGRGRPTICPGDEGGPIFGLSNTGRTILIGVMSFSNFPTECGTRNTIDTHAYLGNAATLAFLTP